jgi:hypothetical protein
MLLRTSDWRLGAATIAGAALFWSNRRADVAATRTTDHPGRGAFFLAAISTSASLLNATPGRPRTEAKLPALVHLTFP